MYIILRGMTKAETVLQVQLLFNHREVLTEKQLEPEMRIHKMKEFKM